MSAPATPELTLQIGTSRYSVEARFVEEILELLPAATIPFLPTPVCGVSMWRGRPVPVVDVALLLDERDLAQPIQPRSCTRGVLVRCGELEAILTCDGVSGATDSNQDDVTTADVGGPAPGERIPLAIDVLLAKLSEQI